MSLGPFGHHAYKRKSSVVIVKGCVEAFYEGRTIGEAIWKIPGFFKLLYLLKASNPKTARPQILRADRNPG